MNTFNQLPLHPSILKAVDELGYTTPTPIQTRAIPLILAGRDLMAGAQTGTGKTAAFLLPILDYMAKHPKELRQGVIRVLVLVPTRELAAQVDTSAKEYGHHLGIRTAAIFGGVGQGEQVARINRGLDILVATPGRLLDLNDQGLIDLSSVEKLVLDEADRMLDMGFIHDVREIIALVPDGVQRLMFSATFRGDVVSLAKSFLNAPERVQVSPQNVTADLIAQTNYRVGRTQKMPFLAHLIRQKQWSQVLVFTRTKHTANKVADYLEGVGIPAMAFHGNKSQSVRQKSMADFRVGTIKCLIATDIMARGIDIEELPQVVNYDIPSNPEDYVHRIGRTGRAGVEGSAINLVSLDEAGFMANIEQFIGQSVPTAPMEGELAAFLPAENEVAEPIAMGRQTLWGGLGQQPSASVMASYTKAARQEMLTRLRDKKSMSGRPKSHAPRQEPASRDERGANSQERGPRSGGGTRHPFSLRRVKRQHDNDGQMNVLPKTPGDSVNASNEPGRAHNSADGQRNHGPAPKRAGHPYRRHLNMDNSGPRETKVEINEDNVGNQIAPRKPRSGQPSSSAPRRDGSHASRSSQPHRNGPKPRSAPDYALQPDNKPTWHKNPGVVVHRRQDDSILGSVLSPEELSQGPHPTAEPKKVPHHRSSQRRHGGGAPRSGGFLTQRS